MFQSNTSRSWIKYRIIRDNLLPYKCQLCDSEGQWNDKPLKLQLDHINGDGKDNRLENLRFLCPNCHSQTATFSKQKNRRSIGVEKLKQKILENIHLFNSMRDMIFFFNYTDHGTIYSKFSRLLDELQEHENVIAFRERQQQRRSEPRFHARKVINRPSKEELEKMVWEKSCVQIANEYNVTDNTIGKWCKQYNIQKPKRGYWAKKYANKI